MSESASAARWPRWPGFPRCSSTSAGDSGKGGYHGAYVSGTCRRMWVGQVDSFQVAEDDELDRVTEPMQGPRSTQVLANGLDFIADALDKIVRVPEASRQQAGRLTKYALLHLSSGVELVLKARLFDEHWTYVFADMNKADRARLQSGDFVSARAVELFPRLASLCGVQVPNDAVAALQTLRNMRNRAEHFALTANVHAVEGIVKRAVPITIQFVVDHCGKGVSDPSVMDLLDQIRPLVTAVTQNHDHAEAIARVQAAGFEGGGGLVLTCPECEGRTLLIDDEAHCVLCDYRASGSEAASLYAENVLGISAYEVVKDGGVFPVHECPECQDDSLVLGALGKNAACLSCGFTADNGCFTNCPSCGNVFIESQDGPVICGPCLQYRLDKDD